MELHGKPIAITGASSGIGRATAMACARAGMPVGLMARRGDLLTRTAEAIRDEGGTAWTFAGDVTDAGACRAFIEGAEGEVGPLHAMFANAGYGAEVATWSMDHDAMRRMFEVNFWGSMNVVRPALAVMTERRAGHIVFCSSCLSKIGVPMYGTYCATKACQDHVARAMRHELKPMGISVSSVHPIGTKTEFFETAQQHSGGELKLMDRRKDAFMQPASNVADAVVRRLRKDRGGEVWTSLAMRLGLGFATAAPGIADLAIGRLMGKRSGDA